MAVLTVWLNAFIPRTVKGYTKELSKGPHKGKTAVPLPGVARLWPGNLFKNLDTGYLTDQRGFSNALASSARMKSVMFVDVGQMTLADQKHSSSGTTAVDLETGTQLDYGVANMRKCQFSVARSLRAPGPKPTGGSFQNYTAIKATQHPLPAGHTGISVWLTAAAGDPLVGMAADIDYEGLFNVSTDGKSGAVTLSFYGAIDAFPAYDCYATLNGVTKEVFTAAPPEGNTVTDLLGPASRPITASVRFG
jgi:hypothetical protein